MTTPVPPPPTPAASAGSTGSSRSARASIIVEQHPNAALITAVSLLALLAIAVSFWASNFSSAESWKAATLEARADRDTARSALADVEGELETLQASSDDLREQVSVLESEAAAVIQKAADLEEQEAEIAVREAAVTKTEDQIAADTISEGIWTIGVDIAPGTYRTKESPYDCYWAIYTSGTNQDDIIQNDIVTGGTPTVTLREGQDFETNRCGEWVKQ